MVGFDAVTSLLGGPLERRLVASTVLVIAAIVVGRFVVPRALGAAREALADVVVRGRLADLREATDDAIPWERLGWTAVRSVQLVVFAMTALSLLVVWGQTGLVVTALALLSGGVPFLWSLVQSVVLVVGAYAGIHILEQAVEEFVEGSDRLSQHQEEIAFRVLELTVIAGVALTALSIWGVDLGGLLVGAGFVGIVVGMAARQTLGSLIAGFVLMFSKPFEVGDWVQIGDEEGRVTDITIVSTRLENPDGEFVSLPNDLVANEPVSNRSRKGRLRLGIEVGIDYDADPERAKSVAVEAITELGIVMPVPQPEVLVRRFGDSAVVLEVRCWINHPSPRRRARTIDAVAAAVKAAFDREGIGIPFPQREVSNRAGPTPRFAGKEVERRGSSTADGV